ncbi:PAS domain-containing protein (plasmid) [Skermanella mucosa]|uniref:PAS domain-containing protein n=1 Tax=Skermanella mucosa TaxID=1789672 RepID=UPI00192B2B1B|nr:PAS domain-containing protein [Skermanella mucosa]UEM25346.1 PAS domain-containing protein [Skermanella mucosa]
MAADKGAPQNRSVVQAQPNLESWPFVAVVQASHTPTTLTDPRLPDNPIIFANDAFVRLTGYGRDEILGRNCRFLGGPDTDREASNAVRNAVEEARAVSMTLLNYRKDGSPFWNQLHVSPIFDEVGMLAYFVGYQHDVTAQAEAERALRNARQELEERLAERERLILEIHHRVRNNLQTIVGLLNLEVGRGDPRLRQQFNLITQRIRVLGSIHEQLERFNQWTAIDFGRHLEETCGVLGTLFEERVAIRVDADPFMCDIQAAVPLGLIANELIAARIERIIRIGLAEHGTIQVVFRHRRQDDTIELAISDTGRGDGPMPSGEIFPAGDIVDVLVEQLGAELTVDPAAGWTVKLTVPRSALDLHSVEP